MFWIFNCIVALMFVSGACAIGAMVFKDDDINKDFGACAIVFYALTFLVDFVGYLIVSAS